MARPTLTTHRTFTRLARLLGGPAIARGTLELVWDVCYQSGDAKLGDALDVEEAACWQGERGACVSALVACGFLDASPDGETFEVHDLFDHAPDYVLRRAEREQARQAKGTTISEIRRNAAQSRWSQAKHANDRRLQTGTYATERTPAPAPAPAPAPTHNPPPAPSTGAGVSEADVWDAWRDTFTAHVGPLLALTPRGTDMTHLRTVAGAHVARDALETALRLFFAAPEFEAKRSLGMFVHHLPQVLAWARTHPGQPYGDAKAAKRAAKAKQGDQQQDDFVAGRVT